jgi:hypothetical protein
LETFTKSSRLDELEKQGWVRQFVASEPRLSEAVELYEESGFEVRLEPFPKAQGCEDCAEREREDPAECRTCFEGSEDRYKIIYTRKATTRRSL